MFDVEPVPEVVVPFVVPGRVPQFGFAGFVVEGCAPGVVPVGLVDDGAVALGVVPPVLGVVLGVAGVVV